MMYDAVLCVAEKHTKIAIKAIRSLQKFSGARKIFVITSVQNFDFLNKFFRNNSSVQLVNEDQIINDINLLSIKEILKRRTDSDKRAGWYFQQFLKMAICESPEIADYYLIWDSDTILLQPIEFFNSNDQVLITPKTEYHTPYFDLTRKILGLDKQVNFSFISEHLMVKKEYMRSLIKTLQKKAKFHTSWIDLIMSSIDDDHLSKSGFSEYETYGNFVTLNFKDSFQCRHLKSTRKGAKLFGTEPDRYAIFNFMQAGFDFVTFEFGYGISRRKLFLNKTIARALYFFFFLTRQFRAERQAAAALTP